MESNVAQGATKRKPSLFDSRNKKFLAIFIVLIAIAGIYIIYRSFASTGVVMTGAEGEFTPVAPARVLDTRNGSGGLKPFAANAEQTLKLTANAGIPASNVSSVVVNLTVVNAPADGFVTIWPSGESKPSTSNINFKSGQTIANQVTVKVGADGKIKIASSSGNTNIVLDVFGYYSTKDGNRGSRFKFQQQRVVDTRSGYGILSVGGPIGSGNGDVKITKFLSNDTRNIKAATYTLTAVDPKCDGYFTVWPTGSPRPLISNLNYKKGETISNQITVPVGQDNSVSLYSSCAGGAYVVIDLVGYYSPPASNAQGSQQGRYYPVSPYRSYDTRNYYNLPLRGGEARKVRLKASQRPNNIAGVNMNAIIINPTSTGYFTGWEVGKNRPLASNINFVKGQTIAGTTTVGIPTSISDIYINSYINTGSAQFAIDTYGYFAADGAEPVSSQAIPNQGLFDVKSISAGNSYTCAVMGITQDNKVNCWGNNSWGQLGDGTVDRSLVPKAVIGNAKYTNVFTGINENTCAAGLGRDFICWGKSEPNSDRAQKILKPTPITSASVAGASVGSSQVCTFDDNAYLSYNNSLCWGNIFNGSNYNYIGPPGVSTGIKGTYGIAALDSAVCAISFPEKVVYCKGENSRGQLGDGTRTFSSTPKKVSISGQVKQISGSYSTVCALTIEGKVFCWGQNSYGQGGADPKLYYSIDTPKQVADLDEALSISVGPYHTCAVVKDNTARCWGRNSGNGYSGGQLGDGTTQNSFRPVIVKDIQNVGSVSAGLTHTCAIAYKYLGNVYTDNQAFCWGDNNFGQLGDGTVASRLTPALVAPENFKPVGSIVNFIDTDGATSISMDMTPMWGEDGFHYYSLASTFKGTDIQLYSGIQTNGNLGKPPDVGNVYIFSIWKATSAFPENGSTPTPFEGEGEGYSLRMKYDWKVGGTYTVRIERQGYDAGLNGGAGGWLWTSSITDKATGIVTKIGAIPTQSQNVNLINGYAFHERFVGNDPKCTQSGSNLEKAGVRFNNLKSNVPIQFSGTSGRNNIFALYLCSMYTHVINTKTEAYTGFGVTKSEFDSKINSLVK